MGCGVREGGREGPQHMEERTEREGHVQTKQYHVLKAISRAVWRAREVGSRRRVREE